MWSVGVGSGGENPIVPGGANCARGGQLNANVRYGAARAEAMKSGAGELRLYDGRETVKEEPGFVGGQSILDMQRDSSMIKIVLIFEASPGPRHKELAAQSSM